MHDGTADSTILIRLQNLSGEEVVFRVKPNTQFRKVADAYCARAGLDYDEVRFVYANRRCQSNATFEELGIQIEDVVQVLLEQRGD